MTDIEEAVVNETEHEDPNKLVVEDPENPVTAENIDKIERMLKNTANIVQIMESQWMASANELKLNDAHMRALAVYNDEHKVPKTDEQTEDEYDPLNGIDHITREEAIKIFGEGHPIIGVDDTHTLDRVKGACQDFYQWVFATREYQNIHDAYIRLLELQEEKEINKLREKALNETDEAKKEKMLASIEQYYNWKFLDFLAEELDDVTKKRLVNALSDEKKVEYWLNRTRDKLNQLKISQKFILEIAQYERRFMESKYHKCANCLLLYFMTLIIYSDTANKKDPSRTKVVCMVTAMDQIIRNQWSPERAERVKKNIAAFEDQLIDLVPEPPVEDITPPVTSEETTTEE